MKTRIQTQELQTMTVAALLSLAADLEVTANIPKRGKKAEIIAELNACYDAFEACEGEEEYEGPEEEYDEGDEPENDEPEEEYEGPEEEYDEGDEPENDEPEEEYGEVEEAEEALIDFIATQKEFFGEEPTPEYAEWWLAALKEQDDANTKYLEACPNCKSESMVEIVGDTIASHACLGCGCEFNIQTGEITLEGEQQPEKQPEKQPEQTTNDDEKKAASKAKASASIAKSWEDEGVRAARKIHHSVTVDGVQGTFRSVREAFKHLGLPDSKHIPFRLKLKAEGTKTFTFGKLSYTFHALEVTPEVVTPEVVTPEVVTPEVV